VSNDQIANSSIYTSHEKVAPLRAGILCLIFQSASVLAETSQPTAVSSEQVVTAQEVIPKSRLLTATFENQITSVESAFRCAASRLGFSGTPALIERYVVIAGYPDSTYRVTKL